MNAQIVQFPYGGKHVRQIPISVPQAQAEPLRALSRHFDGRDDSYRLSPALTVGSEMLKLACHAFIFGTFCVALTMFIYTVF